MLRRLPCAILRLFFRRVEVAGLDHVPATGPVIFVLNHPNALIDPLILICRSGRRVSFLAKEPLFRMPIIGAIIRAMDSIPVYRRMDQADTAQNAATFEAARSLLARGGSLALFPEGTSHSDSRLKPFRTGAARIALGAGLDGLVILPAGLFYTAKSRFRSQVLLCFGPPLTVAPAASGSDGEPPPGSVRDLTEQLEHALGALTLQADQHQALELAETAERIVITATDGSRDLAARMDLRRRLLAGYTRLKTEAPARLDAVVSEIERYQSELDNADLTPELLPTHGYRTMTVLRVTGKALAVLLLLLPLSLVGVVLHFPAWILTDLIGRRYRRAHLDMVSTVKVIAGLVWYPLTWIALAWVVGRRGGVVAGMVGFLSGPITAFATLHFTERLNRLIGGAKGLLLALTGRRRFLRLVAERKRIRDELEALGRELESPQSPTLR